MLIQRTFQFLLMLAVASLVLNDVVRLSYPEIFQQNLLQQNASEGEEEKQDDNNPTNTLFEEEVKHKATKDRFEPSLLVTESDLDTATAHLISDDNVRHLAFMPIFSPPPNLRG